MRRALKFVALLVIVGGGLLAAATPWFVGYHAEQRIAEEIERFNAGDADWELTREDWERGYARSTGLITATATGDVADQWRDDFRAEDAPLRVNLPVDLRHGPVSAPEGFGHALSWVRVEGDASLARESANALERAFLREDVVPAIALDGAMATVRASLGRGGALEVVADFPDHDGTVLFEDGGPGEFDVVSEGATLRVHTLEQDRFRVAFEARRLGSWLHEDTANTLGNETRDTRSVLEFQQDRRGLTAERFRIEWSELDVQAIEAGQQGAFATGDFLFEGTVDFPYGRESDDATISLSTLAEELLADHPGVAEEDLFRLEEATLDARVRDVSLEALDDFLALSDDSLQRSVDPAEEMIVIRDLLGAPPALEVDELRFKGEQGSLGLAGGANLDEPPRGGYRTWPLIVEGLSTEWEVDVSLEQLGSTLAWLAQEPRAHDRTQQMLQMLADQGYGEIGDGVFRTTIRFDRSGLSVGGQAADDFLDHGLPAP